MIIINKIKFIFKLGISTPYFIWIIFLNLLSSVFTLFGIPLLLPALEYLRTDIPEERNLGYAIYIEKIFDFLNLNINFYSIVILASLLIIAGQILLLCTELFSKHIQIKVINKYMTELIIKYYKSSWSWITNDRSGNFHSVISREVMGASETHLDSLRIFTSLFQFTIYIILALSISVISTIYASILFIIIMSINIKYANNINNISKDNNEAYKNLSSLISSLTQNKKFFKALQNYENYMNIIIKQIKKVNKTIWKLTLLDSSLRTFTIMSGMIFIILIFLFHPILNLNLSEIIILLLVFTRLVPQFNMLSSNYNRIMERLPIYKSVNDRILELQFNEEITGDIEYSPGKSVIFNNVGFSYYKDKSVLNNINIEIKPYKTTAFVGKSGAGKSTFLDLYLALLKPTSGEIFYGKIPHYQLNAKTLRSKVAYVSQETTLLEGSLLFNLKVSNPDSTLEEVKMICKKVKLNEFIDQLPDGLNTEIGENGIKLSGGQRQRVAIARALLNYPEILVLDEATSQLDSDTEHYIKDSIINLRSSLTILIVTHRLSSVKFADKVYVFEKGKVIEDGTYDELLKRKGRLFELDSLQNN